jgi:hypothetical protein
MKSRASLPVTVEEPTNRASLIIQASHGESSMNVALQVPPEDGGGLVSMCIGIGGSSVVGVGGPALTLWAAHAASFGPGWAWTLAAAQLGLAGFIARVYRHRPTK